MRPHSRAPTRTDEQQGGRGTARTREHGQKRHGTARHSMTRNSMARHGTAHDGTDHQGTARHGEPRHGVAQHGTARHGMARHAARHAAFWSLPVAWPGRCLWPVRWPGRCLWPVRAPPLLPSGRTPHRPAIAPVQTKQHISPTSQHPCEA